MFNNKTYRNACLNLVDRDTAHSLVLPFKEPGKVETGTLEITGTGRLSIRNTGGSSAAEGGMGSGSKDDSEQGKLKKPGEKSGDTDSASDSDTEFDPIKKKVKEAEKSND